MRGRLGASRLLFLTDVPGVKGASGAVLPEITLEQSRELDRERRCPWRYAGQARSSGIRHQPRGRAKSLLPTAANGTSASGFWRGKRSVRRSMLPRRQYDCLPLLTVRKAAIRDIHAILDLINAYAAEGVMLPRTEFEMSENIRDFSVAYEEDRSLAAALCISIRP